MKYMITIILFLTAAGSHHLFQEKPRYEISTVAGPQNPAIQLSARINPNPARESLVLTVGAGLLEQQLTYSLSDVQGRNLLQDRLVKTSTTIDVSKLKAGTYFIKVVTGNRQVKSFKVLKVR